MRVAKDNKLCYFGSNRGAIKVNRRCSEAREIYPVLKVRTFQPLAPFARAKEPKRRKKSITRGKNNTYSDISQDWSGTRWIRTDRRQKEPASALERLIGPLFQLVDRDNDIYIGPGIGLRNWFGRELVNETNLN